MEAKKDTKTGIIRHTYGTVYPKECKQFIADSGYVVRVAVNGKEMPTCNVKPTDEAFYDIEFKGDRFNIISTGTRTIIVGTNDRKMIDLFKALHGEEWEYDNLAERTDFV